MPSWAWVWQVSSVAGACSRMGSCMLYSWSWQNICILMDILALTVETSLLLKTHKMTVVRKGLWGLCNPPPCPKQYQLELVVEGLILSGFEYLRECRLNKLSRQFLCFTPIMDKPLCTSVCAHCLFFSQLSPVGTVWLNLLYCPLPDIFKISPWVFSSPGWTSPLLFLHQMPKSLSYLCGSFLHLQQNFHVTLVLGSPGSDPVLQMLPINITQRKRSPLLTSSVVLRSLNIDLLNLKIFLFWM